MMAAAKTKGRILTGHRPTGPRHIGHLVGTLEQWAAIQDDYECFFLIADLHVLTTDYEHPGRIQQNITDVMVDWLAAGLDPKRATFVRQSALMEHAQLAVLFGMLTTVSRLERVPTYKEQIQQLGLNPSLGLLTYPVLQSADILVYKANLVPVGEDQLPHIELTREIARRFNTLYGETFPEPEGLLTKTPRLPGTDNRMMHSSYGNSIRLGDTLEETAKKIMSMYTDPKRIHATDPGTVEGKVGDVEVKRRLAEALNAYLAPLRARRAELIKNPKDALRVLDEGTEKARPLVQATLKEVLGKMGLK